MPKNVKKREAIPSRFVAKPGDHDLGLWVDYDLLRKHQRHPPETILYASTNAANNRYLQLADLALGNKRPRKKSKAAA